jgi:hypothetical protein
LQSLKEREEDNIKMGLGEIGLEVVDWINVAQDRDRGQTFVNTVLDHSIP